MQEIRSRIVTLAAALAIVGCGGAQLSEAKVGEVDSTVRAAEEVGAEADPVAALHLHLAEEQLAEAKRLAGEGEESPAQSMLERAKADADLALQLAHSRRQQEEARAAWQKIEEFEKSGS